MADALDSKSSGGKPRVGSSPTSGTTLKPDRNWSQNRSCRVFVILVTSKQETYSHPKRLKEPNAREPCVTTSVATFPSDQPERQYRRSLAELKA